MSIAIRTSVAHSRLTNLVPPGYRKLLPNDDSVLYTVMLFPKDRKSVVYSGVAKRALRKLTVPPGEALIAVGGAFTREACVVLDAVGAQVIALSDFPWTDDSYTQVRGR